MSTGQATSGLRIVSDGTVIGTRVYTSTGLDITADMKIRKVTWVHEAGGLPHAVLDCIVSKIEATLDQDYVCWQRGLAE